jgi:hypothetical protein
MNRQMQAIQAKGGKLSDLPPPPPSNYDHYVQCRHCGRKYAADVAERHIPKCATIINKPGGIKPSRIQEKYVGGTGAGRATGSYVQPKSTMDMPMKPNFSTVNSGGASKGYSNVGASSKPSSKVEQPSSMGSPFGNSYKPSSNIKPARPPQQPGFESPGAKPSFKPNARTNPNKYW